MQRLRLMTISWSPLEGGWRELMCPVHIYQLLKHESISWCKINCSIVAVQWREPKSYLDFGETHCLHFNPASEITGGLVKCMYCLFNTFGMIVVVLVIQADLVKNPLCIPKLCKQRKAYSSLCLLYNYLNYTYEMNIHLHSVDSKIDSTTTISALLVNDWCFVFFHIKASKLSFLKQIMLGKKARCFIKALLVSVLREALLDLLVCQEAFPK